MARAIIPTSLWKDILSELKEGATERLFAKYPHSDYVKQTKQSPQGFIVLADEPRQLERNPLSAMIGNVEVSGQAVQDTSSNEENDEFASAEDLANM